MKKRQFYSAGEGRIVAFTRTDHYERTAVSAYWYGGAKLESDADGKPEPIGLAIIDDGGTWCYAMALHKADASLPMDRLVALSVRLFQSTDQRMWFCLCYDQTDEAWRPSAAQAIEKLSKP